MNITTTDASLPNYIISVETTSIASLFTNIYPSIKSQYNVPVSLVFLIEIKNIFTISKIIFHAYMDDNGSFYANNIMVNKCESSNIILATVLFTLYKIQPLLHKHNSTTLEDNERETVKLYIHQQINNRKSETTSEPTYAPINGNNI